MSSGREEFLQRAYRLGFDYEAKYRGCAQCAYGALQELLGLRNEETDAVYKAATGLSGGVGTEGDGSCGAYSGSVLMIGCFVGRGREDMEDAGGIRFKTLEAVRELHRRFIEEFGTVNCHGVQRMIFGRPFYLPDEDEHRKFDEAGAHREKCPHVVGQAVKWTVEALFEYGLIEATKK